MRWIVLPLLLLQGTASAAGMQTWTPLSEPVYVVWPNHTSEGYDPTSTKFGDLLMVQIHPQIPPAVFGEPRQDGRSLYPVGRLLAFYVDGRRRGSVRIDAVKEHHCTTAVALVTPTLAGISKRVAGIATSGADISSLSGGRRKATNQESTATLRLATREFLRNKVSTSLMTRIILENLVAIDNLRAKTLIGSFHIQTETERHDVFLIARIEGGESTLEYARYRQTTDLEDFKDHESVAFLDHADLDRDGTEEIILAVGGYESEHYEVYHHQQNRWQQVIKGGEAGC